MRIALVNCAALPEPDPDEAPLLGALRAAGHDAEPLAWDDPDADPAAFDLCLLRATWNYHRRLGDFLVWCERAAAGSVLVNPPAVVRWNAHKRYLADLEQGGVRVVPTAFVSRGTDADLRALAADRGWAGVVVKPAVSGGSFGTRLFGAGEHAEGDAYLREMVTQHDMMVQPYLRSVERAPERAVVWIAGEVTHTVEKAPRFAGEDESVRGREPTADEMVLASRIVEAAGREVFYARVDLMDADDGTPLLSELELIEPSLYFDHSGRALARFVEHAPLLVPDAP